MLSENTIETYAISILQKLGWQYTHGDTIAPKGETPWRQGSDEVVFSPLLRDAIARLNPELPDVAVEELLAQLTRQGISTLCRQNASFYDKLKYGVGISYNKDGEEIHQKVRLVDFQKPDNNRFDVVNQLTIKGSRGNRRPDVMLYVNGLPLVVMELKNPADENATLKNAYNQLQTYKNDIKACFVYNQLLVMGDGISVRMGALTADFDRFAPWRITDNRSPFADELQMLLKGLCSPAILLDYVQNFVVFEENAKGNCIKKQANHHQYEGVNKALESTKLALERGDGKIGVMWHTQGSGKSLSMLFYTAKVMSLPSLNNPTVVVVTDRNDLDGQLFATFSSGQKLIREAPIQADSRESLRQELAKREAGGVIFTTIQKFMPNDTEAAHPVLNDRKNIIVMSDEAHRSQYGFDQKINNAGEYRAGYAKHLRDALPNASFIGFTGTPISLEDRDTQSVFGEYISIYDIMDAVNDGATVPIIYEPRQIGLDKSRDYQKVLEKIGQSDNKSLHLMDELLGSDERVQTLAKDLVAHFEQRTSVADGKAMIVASSRKNCVKLYNKIIKERPLWHSDETDKGTIKIMMTGSASDETLLQPHIYGSQDKKAIEARFKDPDDDLKLVIVCDMWLTGFDVPCCHTMYIDKIMQGHNLMQAIARVNRVFKNKSREQGGLIVDYIGLADELQKATKIYINDGGKGQVAQSVDEVFDKMLEYIDIIRGQFATPVNQKTLDIKTLPTDKPNKLLQAITQGANHIVALDRLSKPDGKDKAPRKNAFLKAVRQAKKGYSLCGAMDKAKAYQKELAFYDEVRAVIVKNSQGENGPSPVDLGNIINQAVVSVGVVDLFDIASQACPNIGLLSDEFLAFVKDSDNKELWVLATEKYLKQQIKSRAGCNVSAKEDFAKKLGKAMEKYHSHQLSVVQVLTSLIELGREFTERLSRGETLGLSFEEIAFYDALAKNDSSQLLGDKTLQAMAKEITQILKRSLTVDWQYKEDAKANLRVLVRRLLRDYRYPPDRQPQAVEYVIKQAEVLAGHWSASTP